MRRRKQKYFILFFLVSGIVVHKREYNSVRRRKLSKTIEFDRISKIIKIRENITPWGDGNLRLYLSSNCILCFNKREYNSVRRRKQFNWNFVLHFRLKNKREYNSVRRRKLVFCNRLYLYRSDKIRENITPWGDGNFFMLLVIFLPCT